VRDERVARIIAHRIKQQNALSGVYVGLMV
jgi:hypothetical protein